MDDYTPLLLILAVCLTCAWIAYRGERQLSAERLKAAYTHNPSDSEALVAAMNAAIYRLHGATKDLTEAAYKRASKRPDPLPGTQAKPRKPRK